MLKLIMLGIIIGMLVQYLLGRETYIAILGNPIILIILHGIILINSYFLLKGEKYYNENVGAE